MSFASYLRERVSRLTLWQGVFAVLTVLGIYATYIRVWHGLGASTNLNNQFPWGLWIGFDVLCGVGLAAGGFTLVAIVHIFNLEHYRPILRASILTAFLGYVLVILGLAFDLGQPLRIWHPLVMWNPRSVMFEVAWCVMLYTTVLALEFAPVVLEKFGWRAPLRAIRMISVPLMIAGILLSTLHQSSLGSLYLIVPHKLHTLWYTPLLPLLFFLSAICAGM
ncbi:MAG TPA: NrfD/PsrC family molybdoenzyme membrane anchor subunit, partial [Candidatus Acidoferrales bacterium]